ncbi:hypothetical protein QCA50_008831 [Cerrena zonata]|uniref:Uncharacterized protein n=1 Tax=Cerrena zonata TaxID=2478898 RepID=A0AAW0FRE0_9APHY
MLDPLCFLSDVKGISGCSEALTALRNALETSNKLINLLKLSPDTVATYPASKEYVFQNHRRDILENALKISLSSLQLAKAVSSNMVRGNLTQHRNKINQALTLVDGALIGVCDAQDDYEIQARKSYASLQRSMANDPVPTDKELSNTGWLRAEMYDPTVTPWYDTPWPPVSKRLTQSAKRKRRSSAKPKPSSSKSTLDLSDDDPLPTKKSKINWDHKLLAPPGYKISSSFTDPLTMPTIWLDVYGQLYNTNQQRLLSPIKQPDEDNDTDTDD